MLIRRSYMLIAVLILLSSTHADSIDIGSGGIYLAFLETTQATPNWAGLIIQPNGAPLGVSAAPFASVTLNTATIATTQFPGQNLNDGTNYYAAMLQDNFNLLNVQNVSLDDLNRDQLFNTTDFPVFYPEYESLHDDPNDTFCCQRNNITLGGVNFTAFNITLNESVSYYLLKYNNSNATTPLFLVDIDNHTCYNGTACIGVFILPRNNESYHFYALTKTTQYNLTPYIDGIQTSNFSNTALPYNLTVEVRNLFTNLIEPNKSVVLYEEMGQNIFIPLELTGIVHSTYAIVNGGTDGRSQFVAVPTGYQADENYSIKIAVYEDGSLLNTKNLTVTNLEPLPTQRKSFTDGDVNNQVKAAINTMVSLLDFMFIWSSNLRAAKVFNLTYDLATSNYTFTVQHDPGSPLVLKAGAPNRLKVSLTNGGVPQTGSVIVKETAGHLLLSPYVSDMPPGPLPGSERRHFQEVATDTWFTIAPTSTSVVPSNVTLELYTLGGSFIDTINININDSLNIVSGGDFNDDSDLKAKVNSMVSIVDSMFYAMDET